MNAIRVHKFVYWDWTGRSGAAQGRPTALPALCFAAFGDAGATSSLSGTQGPARIPQAEDVTPPTSSRHKARARDKMGCPAQPTSVFLWGPIRRVERSSGHPTGSPTEITWRNSLSRSLSPLPSPPKCHSPGGPRPSSQSAPRRAGHQEKLKHKKKKKKAGFHPFPLWMRRMRAPSGQALSAFWCGTSMLASPSKPPWDIRADQGQGKQGAVVRCGWRCLRGCGWGRQRPGLVLSDGCCWAGLQVLRVKSILLPCTKTVLDTIQSCSHSKSKVFTETKVWATTEMPTDSPPSFLTCSVLMWELRWCLSPR